MDSGWRDAGGAGHRPGQHMMQHHARDDGNSATLGAGAPSILSLHQRRARKRILANPDDTTEQALVEHVKKCRVSSTPGELRLKKDLLDCDRLFQQGVARFDKAVGNPLKCQLTFLCPIGGTGVAGAAAGGGGVGAANAAGARVPTTFSVLVPKFYPHDPPMLYAERGFSSTCSFVREDGQLQVPFLASGAWSSVSTMMFVVQSLLQGLQNYAAGRPQPWGNFPEPAAQPRREPYHPGTRSNPAGELYLGCADGRGHDVRAATKQGDRQWAGQWVGDGAWNALGLDNLGNDDMSVGVHRWAGRDLGGVVWPLAQGLGKSDEDRPVSGGSMDVANSL